MTLQMVKLFASDGKELAGIVWRTKTNVTIKSKDSKSI